jgi:hypothetical protein
MVENNKHICVENCIAGWHEINTTNPITCEIDPNTKAIAYGSAFGIGGTIVIAGIATWLIRSNRCKLFDKGRA